MKRDKSQPVAGFTLVELLVTIAIIAVLAALSVSSYRAVVDKRNTVHCVANLRGITAGALTWAHDRNGKLWTKEDLGYSKYRMLKDPKGLPQLMKDYVSLDIWNCPGGREILKEYENDYTWTVASKFETESIFFAGSSSTVIVWDAFNYTSPSMYNAVDKYRGDEGAGPPANSVLKPHANHSKVNFGYIDGHVETR